MLTVEFQEYMGVKIHKTSIFDPKQNSCHVTQNESRLEPAVTLVLNNISVIQNT